MNFLQFLNEDTTVVNNIKKKEVKKEEEEDKKEVIRHKSQGNHEKELTNSNLTDIYINNKDVHFKNKIHNDYKEFTLKAGDFVKVIRPSPRTSSSYRLCDIYCGYYGIVKTYYKSTNHASVILDAPNNNPTIYFLIDYLEKVN